MADSASIGSELRAARRARGWSTQVAARRLGVSTRFLNELERGKASARLDKVMQALEGLGLQLAVVSGTPSTLRVQVLARKPLLQAIAAKHGVRALSLFGSAARDDGRLPGDLDFLVELEAGRSLVDLVGIKHDLEALFGRPVDVFTAATLKPRVLASARKDLLRVL